jgi:hypothetical protein
MKKRKTKTTVFRTPEEREAWEIRSEATDRMLRDRLERNEAELLARNPDYRGLGYWIAQVKAERDAGTWVPGRKRFATPEEREEQEIRSEAIDRMLRDRLERIEAELAAKDPSYRGLGYWVAQVRAEREAENAA